MHTKGNLFRKALWYLFSCINRCTNSTFSEYNMLSMPKFLYATFSVLIFKKSSGYGTLRLLSITSSLHRVKKRWLYKQNPRIHKREVHRVSLQNPLELLYKHITLIYTLNPWRWGREDGLFTDKSYYYRLLGRWELLFLYQTIWTSRRQKHVLLQSLHSWQLGLRYLTVKT